MGLEPPPTHPPATLPRPLPCPPRVQGVLLGGPLDHLLLLPLLLPVRPGFPPGVSGWLGLPSRLAPSRELRTLGAPRCCWLAAARAAPAHLLPRTHPPSLRTPAGRLLHPLVDPRSLPEVQPRLRGPVRRPLLRAVLRHPGPGESVRQLLQECPTQRAQCSPACIRLAMGANKPILSPPPTPASHDATSTPAPLQLCFIGLMIPRG